MEDFKFKAHQKVYLVIKRFIAIIGSIAGLFFCLGLFWWWIFIVNLIITKGHPIFVQKRIGKNKKVFKLLKFRSMELDSNPNLAPSDMEVEDNTKNTKFGSFLRKTSLDETLQLFNILIGQMSFIGPRPGNAVKEEHLIECREKYTPNAYVVKPGLTGLAQVRMKRGHNPEKKAYFDHEYVKNLSLWLDIKIFVLTILKLFGAIKGE